MKKLITIIALTLCSMLTRSQELDIKSSFNRVTREKVSTISSISIDEDRGVIVITGKDGGYYSIKTGPEKDANLKGSYASPKYYTAESQTEVISISFSNGSGTYRNLTKSKTIEFIYK